MTPQDILELYKNGEIDLEEALEQISGHGIEEMGFATIDTDRQRRTGLPEVIYASGKTVEQITQITTRMYQKGIDILATRVTPEMAHAVKEIVPEAEYNDLAKTVAFSKRKKKLQEATFLLWLQEPQICRWQRKLLSQPFSWATGLRKSMM